MAVSGGGIAPADEAAQGAPQLPHPALTWPARILCAEPAGIERRQEPVTAGVPLPQGLLRDPAQVELAAQNGTPVALQTEALSRWPDGSVRWLLLDFAADVPANGTSAYLLRERSAPALGQQATGGPTSFFGTSLQITLQGEDGTRHVAPIAAQPVRLETAGPLRTSALAVAAPATNLADVALALRAQMYTAQPEVRLDLTVTNHRSVALHLEALSLIATLPGTPQAISCAGAGGPGGAAQQAGAGSAAARVETVQTGPTAWGEPVPFTLRSRATGGPDTEVRGDEDREGRLAVAWCAAETDRARATLVVRRFAALHPKGVAAAVLDGQAQVIAAMVPPGCGGITLQPGMAATMECLLRVEVPASAAAAEPATLAERFERPLHAFAEPAWVCATGAMGDLVPADDERFPRYERLTRVGLDELAGVRERRREFGQIDFGDWSYDRYPRGWGNVEYDLPHALFLLYSRSGERRFLDWALDSARHFRDVDVNHGGHPNLPAGAPHVHFTDHAARGNDLGHTWLEGLLDAYSFTGDRRALKTARGIAEFCIQAAAQTDFVRKPERRMGWLLICMTEMYRATLERRYLDGCAPIIEQALLWQDSAGNWPHPIGECDRDPKCLGGKPFMTGMVLEGLRRYHELTNDARVGEMIVRAARWLVTDGVWIAQDHGWVYATCHRFLGKGRTGEIRELDGLLYAYRLTGEAQFLEIALDAWEGCLSRPIGNSFYRDASHATAGGETMDGKGYATLTRSTPHVLARLAALVPERRW